MFGYLAWQEGISLWAGEPASPLQKIAARANGYMAIAVQFAVPTTLNNLAGGIAVGISPWLSGHVGLLRLPCDDGDRLSTFGAAAALGSLWLTARRASLHVRLIFGTLAYGQVSEKLQAMWEAHMPFRLALPRFPTDSDAL